VHPGHLSLRSLYLFVAVLLLLLMPIDHAGILLVLFVAADLGAAALMLRSDTPKPPAPTAIAGDAASQTLYRRTRPELRMRRPAVTIEAQIRWRQQSERHRRLREMF
jgi:hypothetical protein